MEGANSKPQQKALQLEATSHFGAEGRHPLLLETSPHCG